MKYPDCKIKSPKGHTTKYSLKGRALTITKTTTKSEYYTMLTGAETDLLYHYLCDPNKIPVSREAGTDELNFEIANG